MSLLDYLHVLRIALVAWLVLSVTLLVPVGIWLGRCADRQTVDADAVTQPIPTVDAGGPR